ncbi:MAG: hypothetical protein IMW98_07755 [Firmicutes bacterium]|nr:hypothetical protein [Bacillota bacterium]
MTNFPLPFIVLFVLCLGTMIAAPFAVHAKPIYARVVWIVIGLLAIADVILILSGAS